MQIRLGYELIYDCPQPTPMLLMLNVHYTRVSDLVEPDHLVTTPAVPIRGYRDGFGNWCSRIVAPAGQTRLTANAIIKDTGEPDVIRTGRPSKASCLRAFVVWRPSGSRPYRDRSVSSSPAYDSGVQAAARVRHVGGGDSDDEVSRAGSARRRDRARVLGACVRWQCRR